MKLSVEGLNSHYGPAHILFDIALEVGDGEVVALLGRNGAGKSTTFRSIVGLVEQRTGRILFEGTDVSDQPTHAIVSRGLGYVPEERRIFTDLTVDENLEVGRQPERPNAPHWTREKLFMLFPNLAEMRNRPGGRMSGGEQQMLTIARTLMGNPSLVLLDELEKAGTRSDYGRLWDCLLGFLEPETNRRYPDPALQTNLDLSQVSYVATANSLDPLPSPIRDRMRVVTFPEPSADDLDALLPAVIADLARERGLDQSWVPPLDGAEHAAVARHWRGGSVRHLRRIVETLLRERDVPGTELPLAVGQFRGGHSNLTYLLRFGDDHTLAGNDAAQRLGRDRPALRGARRTRPFPRSRRR